jgi:hypothetical protein
MEFKKLASKTLEHHNIIINKYKNFINIIWEEEAT